jgi:hypothetical protein
VDGRGNASGHLLFRIANVFGATRIRDRAIRHAEHSFIAGRISCCPLLTSKKQ